MSSFLNLRFDNDSCQGTFFMDITFRSDWRGEGSGFKCSVSCRPAPSQSTPAPNPALSLPWSGCSCGRPNRHTTIFIRLKNVKLLCIYELIKQNCVLLLCLLTLEYNENTVL